MNAIEVNHLKKSFGDFQAVQDASFNAKSGDLERWMSGRSGTIPSLE